MVFGGTLKMFFKKCWSHWRMWFLLPAANMMPLKSGSVHVFQQNLWNVQKSRCMLLFHFQYFILGGRSWMWSWGSYSKKMMLFLQLLSVLPCHVFFSFLVVTSPLMAVALWETDRKLRGKRRGIWHAKKKEKKKSSNQGHCSYMACAKTGTE